MNFFKDKFTSAAKRLSGERDSEELTGLNALPNELKVEILTKLDYKSLQTMACVSQSWEKLSHKLPTYHSREYYTYSGYCNAGMIRNKTIDIHYPNNGGSGPIFVPFPQVDFDCYRFTNPSRAEFLQAFVQENYQNYPFQLWRNKPPQQKRYGTDDKDYPIFRVKLKRDANIIPKDNNLYCRLSDIQQVMSGEFTWYPKKHFGLFAAKPRHIYRNLKNAFAPEIELAIKKASL